MNGIEFLRWWYGDAIGHMEMTFLWPKDVKLTQKSRIRTTWYSLPREWARMAAEARYFDELNAVGYNVHHGVTLHSIQPPMVDDHATRPKDDTVCLSPGFWADLDVGGLDAVKAEAFGQLAEFDPVPSAVIDSGGGLHAYWKLDAPLEVAGPATANELRATVRGLALVLQSDTSVCNPSRTMRLPGYINTKPERGQRCAVVSCSDVAYPLARFERFSRAGIEVRHDVYLGELPADLRGRLPAYVTNYLASGAAVGVRNQTLYVSARFYNDNRFSLSEAERDLLPRALADGLNEHEALATIRSAFTKEPSMPKLPPRLRNAYAARAALEEAERNE